MEKLINITQNSKGKVEIVLTLTAREMQELLLEKGFQNAKLRQNVFRIEVKEETQ